MRWTEMPESANQANCGRFAAQSELEVSATAGEICVRGQIAQLLPDGEQWQGEMEEVISNGSGQSGKSGEGWTATVESPPPTMVTRCLTPSSDTLILWVQQYDTCVANKDTQGLPVLTERSQFLYFGRARWTFPAATAQAGR